jgi:hypothetical protein
VRDEEDGELEDTRENTADKPSGLLGSIDACAGKEKINRRRYTNNEMEDIMVRAAVYSVACCLLPVIVFGFGFRCFFGFGFIAS